MQRSVLVGDRYVHAPCVAYTHFPPHEPYIVANVPPHNASLVYYNLRMYTLTRYSSSPLCEHRIIHTYGLMCLYTSHICRLMPTNTVIFIVHVCGNALHIGTQCLYDCRMCIYNIKKRVKTGFPYKHYSTASSIAQE